MRRGLVGLAVGIALFAMAGQAALAAESLGLITGGDKGTYYQFGLNLQALIKRIPSDRLMVETDAPFLLPRDLKGVTGRRNEPAFLPHVAASVARFAERSEADVCRDTTDCAFRLFGLAARFAADAAP